MEIKSMSYIEILKKARQLKKEKLEANIKVALLGSKSMQFIGAGLQVGFHEIGLEIDLYESDFDGINVNILDQNSDFYAFNPDVCIIIPDIHDLTSFPTILGDDSETWLNHHKSAWESKWRLLEEHLPNCLIIQTNYVTLPTRVLGQLESRIESSQTNSVNALNLALNTNKQVCMMDLNALASDIGKRHWFDYANYYMSKMPFDMAYLGEVIDEIITLYTSLTKASRKVLVLDLDNTLWGGVIGDEGYEGININPNDPIGEAFLNFQTYIKSLYERGVLLAIASKNDDEVARSAFKNPNMILTEDMFASIKANWEPKSNNIKQMAQELNLGLDSFVFFDDNPFERNIVREFVPEVYIIEAPEDPVFYTKALDESLAFNISSLTKEDLERNKSYLDNKKRVTLLESMDDYDSYLKSLDMTYSIQEINETNYERFFQLTNKSNQFNLRTMRYTEKDILEYLKDPNYYLFGINLKDIYSNYGMIACVILKKDNNTCFIENWVMSCRVLKRNVEDITLKVIVDYAKENNMNIVQGEYIPSARNQMVEHLLDNLGFKDSSLHIEDYQPQTIHIKGEDHD